MGVRDAVDNVVGLSFFFSLDLTLTLLTALVTDDKSGGGGGGRTNGVSRSADVENDILLRGGERSSEISESN